MEKEKKVMEKDKEERKGEKRVQEENYVLGLDKLRSDLPVFVEFQWERGLFRFNFIKFLILEAVNLIDK